MRNKFPKVKGAESAIAHGHAIIKTAVNTFIALLGSVNSQNVVAVNAIANIAMVKCLLMVLVMVVKPSSFFLLKTSLLHNCVR